MELSTEVQTERDRCATWCERLAVVYEQGAARLRKEGTIKTVALTLRWPFSRSYEIVHPNWERVALVKDDAARAVRTLGRAISEGWRLAPLSRDEATLAQLRTEAVDAGTEYNISAFTCEYVFDLYNTDGDCLAEK